MPYEVVERLWFERCYEALLCKGFKHLHWHEYTEEEKKSVMLSLIVCLLPSDLAKSAQRQGQSIQESYTQPKGHQMHSHTCVSLHSHCDPTFQKMSLMVVKHLCYFYFSLLASFGLFLSTIMNYSETLMTMACK